MKSLLHTLGEPLSQPNNPEPPLTTIEVPKKPLRPDSIIDTINSGFGALNTLIKDCPKAEYKTPLFKENFLSEFNTEEEKLKVRDHLGVVGLKEVIELVDERISEEVSQFITIEKIEEMIQDLDLITSEFEFNADYKIPDKIFKT